MKDQQHFLYVAQKIWNTLYHLSKESTLLVQLVNLNAASGWYQFPDSSVIQHLVIKLPFYFDRFSRALPSQGHVQERLLFFYLSSQGLLGLLPSTFFCFTCVSLGFVRVFQGSLQFLKVTFYSLWFLIVKGLLRVPWQSLGLHMDS